MGMKMVTCCFLEPFGLRKSIRWWMRGHVRIGLLSPDWYKIDRVVLSTIFTWIHPFSLILDSPNAHCSQSYTRK